MKNLLLGVIFVISLYCNVLEAQNCPNITGRLTYMNASSTPMRDVEVLLKSPDGDILQTTVTNAEGQFFFCSSNPGLYFLNFSSHLAIGGINATDAVQALRQFLLNDILNGIQLKAADVNQSGYVNSSDALLIAKYFTGLVSTFIAGDWLIEPDTVLLDNEVIYRELKGICYGDPDGSYTPVGLTVMNIPCPGVPTFSYGGQVYNTVQIGSQCWMKENLNIGTMVTSVNTDHSHTECHNNGIIEKYCYNNNASMCEIYGGLYTWDEMMQYTQTAGSQGICPSGWHIPTDQEWCTLTQYLDATVNCNAAGMSGTTIGNLMRETGTSHWESPNSGATNASGFTALGGGYRDPDGYFNLLLYGGFFSESFQYSSTQGVYRFFGFDGPYIGRQNNDVNSGFSVRCIKD
ncbi:MAG: FISUMP domain-containing protein [Bacteroidales bacterium]